MTAFIVIVWSVIGFIAGGIIATEFGPLFGWRNMEGMSAYFGLMFGSPLGLIAGAVLSYKISRHFGEDTKKRGNFLFLTLLGVGALIAGGFIFETIRTRDHLDSMKWLTCKARLKPGATAPDKSIPVVFELRSDKETRKSSPYGVPDWRVEEGRAVVYGNMEVYRATTDRSVAVRIGDGPVYLFKLDTPARPKTYSYESRWFEPVSADGVGGAGQGEMDMKCEM